MRQLPLALLVLAACNDAPVAGVVSIDPLEPLTGDDLTVVIDEDAVDPDKKDTVAYTFTWDVDGTPVEGATDTISADQTAKGEVWTVTVVASDGKLDSPAFSASVTIGNSAPEATAAALAPSNPTTSDDLTATWSAEDADGDALTASFAWTVNGVATGDDSDTLASTAFVKGDAIEVTVTVTDDDGATDSITSATTIENSIPTAPTVAITPDEPHEYEDIVCTVTADATDADADTLNHAITWDVDGVTWDGATGTTVMAGDTIDALDTVAGEVWTCSITADDGEDTGPEGTASVTIAEGGLCGPLLHTDPEQVKDGWTLCYVDGTDAEEIRNAACEDLLPHLDAPVYGCWHGRSTYPHENHNSMVEQACRPDVQHQYSYAAWSGTDHIYTVCIQNP